MSYQILKRYELFKKISPRHQLAKDQVNLLIWCPFCQNKDKKKLKLSIHLEKCFYHCWVCDKKGSNIPSLVNRINSQYKSEAELLFKVSKKKFDLFGEELSNAEEKIVVDMPPKFMFLAECYDHIDPDVKAVLKYAIKRGVNKHKLWMLRLGVSLHDEFRRMLILPSYDKNGELNFYTCRKIDVDTKGSFKYKNALVPKKNIIFNEINLDFNLPLTVVEGPLDLIKTNDNATCLLGSSLNDKMKLFQEIVKNKTEVILALDEDAYDKAIKIARNLGEYDVTVKIVNTSSAEDVGDMTHKQFKQAYDESQQLSETDILLNKIRSL